MDEQLIDRIRGARADRRGHLVPAAAASSRSTSSFSDRRWKVPSSGAAFVLREDIETVVPEVRAAVTRVGNP
ncbi:hypothetical protein [Amycolatopsis sp. NPDC051128]|uniref:hypothetical protein n=1 Tax=Amycolatopsis sp. NPDC051128 TaxID=3155412 RepID=UPI00342A211E